MTRSRPTALGDRTPILPRARKPDSEERGGAMENEAREATYPMYVGGEWTLGEGGELGDVKNPATGETIGKVPLGGSADVDRAVRAARSVAPELARMTAFERAELCFRLSDAISERREGLARTLSVEHGKPLHSEALGEVDACIAAFRESGEQIKWMTSEIIPMRDPNKRAFALRRPRGVYGIITPWNFPLGVACIYYLGPGLAAGNALVWVPPPSTSAVASELMQCVEAADLPKGTINLVIGEGAVVGDAVVTHPGIDAVGFTGSTATGHAVATRAAGKPLLLELGGNGPSIVLDDADVAAAASSIAAGSFANAGQICTSTERLIVHESVAGELADRLAALASEIRLDDPLDPMTTMGPVHTAANARKVVEQVTEAKAKGAAVLAGGSALPDMPTEQFVRPTVVDRVAPDAQLNREETFGPVAPIVRFSRLSDLPSLVAASPYGLSGAIFSRDTERAMLLAEEMPCGIVNINEASSYWEPQTPAGGASGTLSGVGRSGGTWSITEMTELRTVVLNATQGPSLG
jgi:acyl-CoA reductase-like NAD-dependent aldehyde dehydrogenase